MTTEDIGDMYFNRNSISRDFYELTTGKLIGKGQYRTVYQFNIDTSLVIKFEQGIGAFANILEWETYKATLETKYEKWFAPCVAVAPCGTVLLQKFCRDANEDEYPEELPIFFTDIKKSNFGIYDGRFVCRDYGFNLLMDKGLSKRMKKVIWK